MKNLKGDGVAGKASAGQRGVAAVEFALVAIPFFLLLLGAMELGRLMYLWNTAQEVTRNAARQAVVTDFANANAIATIKRAAIFRANDGVLPAGPEISNANVVIRYLNASQVDLGQAGQMPSDPGDNISACTPGSGRTDSCITTVEVCLSTGSTCSANELIAFNPMIELFGTSLLGIRIPLSTVRMPAESLGFTPAT